MSPESGTGPRALLLIARMEFGQIRWENFAGVEAVFAWAMARALPGALAESGTTASGIRLLPSEIFRQRIEEAHRLEKKWNLPARLILFAALPNSPPSGLETFVEKLLSMASPADPIGAIGDGQNTPLAIGMLTPAASSEAGETLARQLLSRIGAGEDTVQHHVFSLTDATRLASGSQGSPQSRAATPAPPAATPPVERETAETAGSAD
jgi:hypothetical protein